MSEPPRRATDPQAVEPTTGRRRATLALQVVGSGLLVGFLISRVRSEDLQDLVDRVSGVGPMRFLVLLSLVLASAAGSVVMSGARFQALCAERAVRISLRTAVRINCLSLLAAVVSPMGVVGDGLRTHMLVKKHRAQLADSIGVVILDRMAGLIASVVVAVVSLAFAGDAPRTAPIRLVLWIVSAGVVGVIVLLFLVGRTARRLGPRRPRGRWATRLAKLEVLDGTELRSKRVIVTSLAGQWLEVVSAVALFRLLGFVQPPTMLIAAGTGFVPLLEALPSSFIGIGAREGALEYLLTEFGEARGSGLLVGTTGLVLRVTLIGVAVLAAGPVGERLLPWPRSRGEPRHHEERSAR